MRVLVTGASGMLGRAVASAVLGAGHDVRTFQRTASGVPGAEDALGSVTDAGAVAAAVGGMDAVVHLAAKVAVVGNPADFERVNVEGTRSVLAAASAASVRRMVHVSSPSVAHIGVSIVGDDARPADPRSARGDYARTKAEAELLALAADSARLHVVVIRPHLVWGPGDRQIVEGVVKRAASGRLPLFGQGAALVDTTYVDNAASGIVAALERAPEVHGRSYVLTNGEPRPVAELLRGICEAAGVPAPSWRVPSGAARVGGALVESLWRVIAPGQEPPMTRFLAEQLSTAHWFDQRRTRAELQWTPAVSVEEGLRRLAASYAVGG